MRRTILQVVAMAAVAVSMFATSASAMHVRSNGGNATYILKKNVAYLPDRTRAEKADLYIPKPTGVKRNDTSRPAMVIVHGGGFTKNDKNDTRERVVSKILASNGVVAMSINYLLSTNKTGNVFPTNIQDCMNAVKYLRINAKTLGVDPERIGILGASAGGNLATMVALTDQFDDGSNAGVSSKVKVLVDMYGNVNLYRHRDYVSIFGKTRVEDKDTYKKYSPYYYVNKDAPATLVIHSDRDPTVSVLQSVRLHQRLKQSGVSSTIITVESNKHSIKVQKVGDVDLPSILLGFLQNFLF